MSGRRPVACSRQAQIEPQSTLVGRADAVGVGGDVGEPLRNPPRRTAEPLVAERHVEGDDDGVGPVVGRVGRRDEPRGLELGDHRGCAQQKETAGGGVVFVQVVDGGQRGGVHLLARGVDAERLQLAQVVVNRLRGIVGQERVADAQLAEFGQEGLRPVEERHAHVDGSVHVERHVTDAAQTLHQLVVGVDGAVFVKFLHRC